MDSVCCRCGARIKNVFRFQGNTYGSECIQKIPFEESSVVTTFDLQAIVTGLEYAKMKDVDLNEIISRIPPIGTKNVRDEYMHTVVVGYGTHTFRPRKRPEFAIRVKTVYPYSPRYNGEGWRTIKSALENTF